MYPTENSNHQAKVPDKYSYKRNLKRFCSGLVYVKLSNGESRIRKNTFKEGWCTINTDLNCFMCSDQHFQIFEKECIAFYLVFPC